MTVRMRTIDQAYAHIKECDPESAISKNALRCMVLKGEIPSVKAGNKYLLSLDALEHYLSCMQEGIAEETQRAAPCR